MTPEQILDFLRRAGYVYLTGDNGIWIGSDDRGNDIENDIGSMNDQYLNSAYRYLQSQRARLQNNLTDSLCRQGLNANQIQQITAEAQRRYSQKEQELGEEISRRRQQHPRNRR